MKNIKIILFLATFTLILSIVFFVYGINNNISWVKLKLYFYGLGVQVQESYNIHPFTTIPTGISWYIIISFVLLFLTILQLTFIYGYLYGRKLK